MFCTHFKTAFLWKKPKKSLCLKHIVGLAPDNQFEGTKQNLSIMVKSLGYNPF